MSASFPLEIVMHYGGFDQWNWNEKRSPGLRGQTAPKTATRPCLARSRRGHEGWGRLLSLPSMLL
jgi:hypothetical protein